MSTEKEKDARYDIHKGKHYLTSGKRAQVIVLSYEYVNKKYIFSPHQYLIVDA